MKLNIKTAVFDILAIGSSLEAFTAQPSDIITNPVQEVQTKKDDEKESMKIGLLGDFYYQYFGSIIR